MSRNRESGERNRNYQAPRSARTGCIYYFARPTHSYLGLSPGLDFESRLFAKVNAAELLRRERAIRILTDACTPEH